MDSRPQEQDIPALVEKHMPGYSQSSITMTPLFGMTNSIFKVTEPGKKPLIFRIFFGQFDRKKENDILSHLSAHGAAPKCYYISEEYRIQQFIENSTHPEPKVIQTDSKLLELIVRELAHFHGVSMPETVGRSIFVDTLFSHESWVKYSDHKWTILTQKEEFVSLWGRVLAKFNEYKKLYEDNIELREFKIKFCHNDLNNLNIFITESASQQEGPHRSCCLIDFEYAAHNYSAFDLANLLSESCFNYTNENPGFVINETVSEGLISRACSLYKYRYLGMEVDVAVMLVIANFYWALWSLQIKGENQVAETNLNFDALKHGEERLKLCQKYMGLLENMKRKVKEKEAH